MDGFEKFARGLLITVFSATNYCGVADNAGAFLYIDKELKVQPYIIYPCDVSNWIDEEDLKPLEPSSNSNFDMEQFSQMMKQYQPIEYDLDEDEIENEIIEEHI